MEHQPDDAQTLKRCCAQLYESDLARFLLGDSFHPGGLALTRRLGELLHLGPQSRVLDVACGKGASAVFVAEHFGCEVVGVDYSDQNVAQANGLAAAKRLTPKRCRFGTLRSMPLFANAPFARFLINRPRVGNLLAFSGPADKLA
jgi:cyclopropane fatty-acyl-phospholipid synthase-like methyltransferase